jgi:hypothetical protein
MQDDLIEQNALELSDLERLANAQRVKDQPAEIFRAVHAVAASAIGARLFTIMSYDARQQEVERTSGRSVRKPRKVSATRSTITR